MLRGRDRELALIGELLDDARRSRSGALVLSGEPGVGKSALLDAARSGAEGMTVLAAQGIESEAELPFAALHQLVRPVLDRVDRLAPPQAQALRAALGLAAGSGESRFLVSLAVLGLLSEEAEGRPVLCLVDDGQWLDDASADALVFLARRLGAEGIALLVTVRDGEPTAFASAGIPALRVEGLDPEAAAALLDDQAPVPLAPEVRERLVAGIAGNPLALMELPRSLSEAELSGAQPLPEPLPVTGRIEQAFLARARGLPEATQTMLIVAAADDGEDLTTVLRAAAALGVPAQALDAAEEAGLVTIRGETFAFRHSLTRSAIYHGAALSRRRAAHEALADALQGDHEADRRAWHRAAGAVEPDADLAAELERTAVRARRRGGPAAASLAYERAAALSPDEATRARLLLAAAEHAWFAGRVERTLTILERADPVVAGPVQRADLARWRGLVEMTHGVPADAPEELIRAAREVAPVDVERALHLLGIASVAAAISGEDDDSQTIADLAGGLALDGASYPRMLRETLVGLGAHVHGDYAEAGRHLREAVGLAPELHDLFEQRPPALLFAGRAALFAGDDEAGRALHKRAAAIARREGTPGLLTQVLPRLGHGEVWAGRWSSASAGAEECVDLGRAIGQDDVVAHALALRALVAGLQSDEERCRALADEAGELGSAHRLAHVNALVRWALTVLALGLGRPEEALGHARGVDHSLIGLWAAGDRIEAAARGGDPESARAWQGELERWADGSGAPWALAAASHGRGLLAEDVGDGQRAFEAALEAQRDAGRPFDRARTHLALGELLRRTRRRKEAREHLRLALEGFEALGAASWAERARLELRASGQTAMRGDPGTRERLTAQELQVAQFVAEGLTNRDVAAQLFLSTRTIEFHLRNIFRKLGIASRTQLARLDLDLAAG